ncbi:hypothetical protein AAFF_G00136860 [Aldrovandia affinis]|uniref:Uncharacterized protein n=1 Tax=Aldrovandia affinis TaxID=143900 RepID=A0AAD7TBM5_9TELE|nr:hypothetical protein AAFF_G00136860 [Aldrovandia affinis]
MWSDSKEGPLHPVGALGLPVTVPCMATFIRISGLYSFPSFLHLDSKPPFSVTDSCDHRPPGARPRGNVRSVLNATSGQDLHPRLSSASVTSPPHTPRQTWMFELVKFNLVLL